MKRKILNTLVFGSVLAGFLTLTACNTMEGLGKDVQSGGEKLENTAEKANK
ncbi:MAG: entericidin A/B family lipoprotein [Pseudomonadota bacterium]|uniref:entericidin A/B family lipoprotein n=1 Tax=Thermithiobacillus tepidarius TaxID=929 RepID=UPI00041BE71E|nr:entericidin A/B family lipoprotein [Thermithiobacillus tepidarius]